MSELTLPWWEHDELLSHLQSRDDIWVQDEENPTLWVRLSDRVERDPCLALQLVPADGENKWRQAYLHCTPLGWTEERCVEYLQALLRNKTSYGTRLETEYVLQTELGLDPQRASRAALILAFIHLVGPVVGEEDLPRPQLDERSAGLYTQPRQFFGGWKASSPKVQVVVHLYRTEGGMLRGHLGLTRTEGEELAKPVELEGVFHLSNMNLEEAHRVLFDEPLPEESFIHGTRLH